MTDADALTGAQSSGRPALDPGPSPRRTPADGEPTIDADALTGVLVRWYRQHARDLPWRSPDTTPWGVLVCEVMAQQTPVTRVAPVWSQWLQRWPRASALAAADTAEVLTAWGNLGYPRRALRLHECARVIASQHDDEVPADYTCLRSLPGVGDYTAAAVLAFGHGRRAVVMDTNVRRVLARAVGGRQWPTAGITVAERAMTDSLLPDGGLVRAADPHPRSADAATWSVAVMEVGACACTTEPKCDLCPLAQMCAWRAAGYPSSPAPRKPQQFHGTDRQARGRIMRLLRESWPHAVEVTQLHGLGSDTDQMERALAGLISDALVEKRRGGQVSLPTSSQPFARPFARPSARP